jgi:uncharacterized membrane protein YczE
VPEIVPAGSSTTRRVATLVAALVLVAVGVACMIRAELGVAPYDVVVTGLAALADIPVAGSAMVVPAVFIGLGAALGGRLAGGTLLCLLLVGPMLGLVIDVLPQWHALAPRIGLYATGFVILAAGITLTVAADIGSGPAELLMLAIHQRGPALAPTRTGIELACVGIGWAMGGQVGAGTVVFAAIIGPALRRTLQAAGFSADRAAEASDLAAPGA